MSKFRGESSGSNGSCESNGSSGSSGNNGSNGGRAARANLHELQALFIVGTSYKLAPAGGKLWKLYIKVCF